MGRMNFGGAQDLSGVFGSLLERQANNTERSVANAKNQAMEDQAAEDKEVYANWKAGKISDAEWLAHLERRRDNALEPEERAEYAELFLEHKGAIADSQMEARFAMGEVSLGALMKHYSGRMGQVKKDSPAWRELAQRYGQLSNAGQSGGGGGGGGRRGGGGGGGSGSGANTEGVVEAGMEMLAGGMFKGIDTAGEDLVDPTMSMMPIEDDDDFINALMSDIERIKQLEDWMKEHPGDNTVIDEMTGETFEVTADFLVELDKQYIRTEQALAATYFARGTTEDVKKGNQALGHATNWVTGPMTRHNTVKTEPLLRQIEQHVFAQMVGASEISDPRERRLAYAAALRDVDRWIRTNLTDNGVEIADALRPDEDTFTRAGNLRDLLDIGANSDKYSPEDISAQVDRILSSSASIGEGGASIRIETLLEGGGGDDSSVPDNFVGLLETMSQEQGLAAGERMLAGNPDPEYDGPLYVYQYDGQGTPRAVIADVRDQPNAFGGVSPVLVPQGGDPESLVMTRVRVGNSVQTVWVQPQPVDDPRFRVYRGRDGALLSSKAIREMGAPRLQALVSMGEVQIDSVLTAAKMPDGNVWFRDNETGLYHLEPPVIVTADELTSGVQVDDDGEVVMNAVPHSKGVIVPFAGVGLAAMGRWTRQAEQAGLINPSMYRARGAGGEVVDLDWNVEQDLMYDPPREAGRSVKPELRQHLKRRVMADEEFFARGQTIRREAGIAERAANRPGRDPVNPLIGVSVGGKRPFGPRGDAAEPNTKPGQTPGGLLDFLFGDPRKDAEHARASRLDPQGRPWSVDPKIKAKDISFAPEPTQRAPLSVLKTSPRMAPPARAAYQPPQAKAEAKKIYDPNRRTTNGPELN